MGLQQYEGIMEDAGYDDIDYVKDITEEELKEIGVKKPGHLKKFQKSIAKLCNLPKGTVLNLYPNDTNDILLLSICSTCWSVKCDI